MLDSATAENVHNMVTKSIYFKIRQATCSCFLRDFQIVCCVTKITAINGAQSQENNSKIFTYFLLEATGLV